MKKSLIFLYLVMCLSSLPLFALRTGDADRDGAVTIVDALIVAQGYVGILSPSSFASDVCDVNGDTALDIVDALLIAQYYVGLIEQFPVDTLLESTVAGFAEELRTGLEAFAPGWYQLQSIARVDSRIINLILEPDPAGPFPETGGLLAYASINFQIEHNSSIGIESINYHYQNPTDHFQQTILTEGMQLLAGTTEITPQVIILLAEIVLFQHYGYFPEWKPYFFHNGEYWCVHKDFYGNVSVIETSAPEFKQYAATVRVEFPEGFRVSVEYSYRNPVDGHDLYYVAIYPPEEPEEYGQFKKMVFFILDNLTPYLEEGITCDYNWGDDYQMGFSDTAIYEGVKQLLELNSPSPVDIMDPIYAMPTIRIERVLDREICYFRDSSADQWNLTYDEERAVVLTAGGFPYPPPAVPPAGIPGVTLAGALELEYGSRSYWRDAEAYGDTVYALTRLYTLQIYDISDKRNPRLREERDILPADAGDIALFGNYLYAFGPSGTLAIYDLSLPADPSLITTLTIPGEAWNISFYGERAFISGGSGIGVYDLSNPGQPQLLDVSFPVRKAYDTEVTGDYMYVQTDDPKNSLKLFRLLTVVDYTVFDQWAYDGSCLTSTENRLYSGSGVSVNVFDITTPYNPQHEGIIQVEVNYDSREGILDLYAAGPILYVLMTNQDLRIYDTGAPLFGSELTGHLEGMSSLSDMIFADEYAVCFPFTEGAGITVYNNTNPEAPQKLFAAETFGRTGDLVVQGDFAYLVDGKMGMKIIDISSPGNPVLRGFLSLERSAASITVGGDYAYLPVHSSRQYIVNVADPGNPFLVADLDLAIGEEMEVHDGYLYSLHINDGLYISDLSDPVNPVVMGPATFDPARFDYPYPPDYEYTGYWAAYTMDILGEIAIPGTAVATLPRDNILFVTATGGNTPLSIYQLP